MSRKEGQKRKLLVLLEILARETDEKHPLSVPQLVEKLQEHGVVAERKSVYDDLNTLNNLPDTKYEIVQQRGRGGGYYMTEAPFELAELKLLVDAVYASKFITARKSKILIDKLGQFTSTYRQEELDRKVLVSGRIRAPTRKFCTPSMRCTPPSRQGSRSPSNTATGTCKSGWPRATTASSTASARGCSCGRAATII